MHAVSFEREFRSEGKESSTRDRLLRLDSLLDLDADELGKLYGSARVPKIEDVKGPLRGRMLAWPVLAERTGVQALVRSFAASKAFPWRGKSFMPHDTERGEGINRVVSEKFRLFRFDTFIGASRDESGGDALQLDYDLDGNPPVIRSIKDEIRELEPGLWLGQAYYQTKTGHWLWLYFALANQS